MATFDFATLRGNGALDWDSDAEPIESWSRLLARSFAELRNNIAYGSKGNPPRPFTHGRTPMFLSAGHAMMTFLTNELFPGQRWDEPLHYA